MKPTKVKKEKKQVIEIHIYIHQDNQTVPIYPVNPIYPGTAPYNPFNPPYNPFNPLNPTVTFC